MDLIASTPTPGQVKLTVLKVDALASFPGRAEGEEAAWNTLFAHARFIPEKPGISRTFGYFPCNVSATLMASKAKAFVGAVVHGSYASRS